MDHLWLERSLLLITILSLHAPEGGGDTRMMRKVRDSLFPANNSSQAVNDS